MRKWTKSACVVIAWCTLSIVAVVGSRGPDQSAQAHISIANSAQLTLASAPGTRMTVAAVPAAAKTAATWVVRPGDTLTAIAGSAGHTGSAGSSGSAGRAGGARSTAATSGVPRWLKDILLAAGLLAVLALFTEPVAALARRRRRASRPDAGELSAAGAADKAARIIRADHERLIVTYSVSDNTVYVLTPPGEDPRAVLRAARLVLPEDTYEELAGHLGLPSGWPAE